MSERRGLVRMTLLTYDSGFDLGQWEGSWQHWVALNAVQTTTFVAEGSWPGHWVVEDTASTRPNIPNNDIRGGVGVVRPDYLGVYLKKQTCLDALDLYWL